MSTVKICSTCNSEPKVYGARKILPGGGEMQEYRVQAAIMFHHRFCSTQHGLWQWRSCVIK